jgi:hypothetical protein
MKDTRSTDIKILALIFALIATIFGLLGSESLSGVFNLPAQVIGSALLGAVVYWIFVTAAAKSKLDDSANGITPKLISLLLIACIITCVATATRSLWFHPLSPDFGAIFAYENTATFTGLAAIFLVFILSALQKDIYWINRKRTLKLDERQIKDRQTVFERSYKLGAFLVLGATWYFKATIHNLPAIIGNNWGSVPGHLYWLPVNLTITLFALPLIVAAWKSNKA